MPNSNRIQSVSSQMAKLSSILLLAALVVIHGPAQAEEPAVGFVRNLETRVRGILLQNSPGPSQHQDLCQVVFESTAWTEMTVRAMGQLARNLSESEISAAAIKFRGMLSQTLATTFSRLADSQVEFDERVRQSNGEQVVTARIFRGGADPMDVRFHVASAPDLRLIDASFRGLRLMSAYQGDFTRVQHEALREGRDAYQAVLAWMDAQAPACAVP